MPRKISIPLLGVLAGIAGGALFEVIVRSTTRAEPVEAVGIPESHFDLGAIPESIRALDQRVARIEAELSSREPSVARTPLTLAPQPDGASEAIAAASKELVTLREELLRTSQRIELLEDGLKDSGFRWLRSPTREQFERARKDVNWTLVDEIRALHHRDYAAALERVSALSIDDILQQLGRPTGQEVGIWYYTRPRPGGDERSTCGISLHFVGQRVAGVGVSD